MRHMNKNEEEEEIDESDTGVGAHEEDANEDDDLLNQGTKTSSNVFQIDRVNSLFAVPDPDMNIDLDFVQSLDIPQNKLLNQ